MPTRPYGPDDYFPHRWEEDDLIDAIDAQRIFDPDADVVTLSYEILRPLARGRKRKPRKKGGTGETP